MDLGRYCVDVGDGVYYDSLSHQRLTADRLAARHLLAGQEHDALRSRLLAPVPAFVTIVPSWECNLRCPHCYVGHLLQRPSGNHHGNLDANLLVNFLQRVHTHWGVAGYCVVGGEPLLHPELLRTLQQQLPFTYTITTNGVWAWDATVELLADPKLKVLTFSIDGLPEDHNRLRRSLDRLDDVFAVTYRNLARATKAFPDKEIVAQGSVVDRPYSDADCERYLALMLLAGVKPANIRLGVAAPSRQRKSTPLFDSMIKTAIRFKPCCDYQAGKQLVIAANRIYPSYYELDRVAPLGTLSDDTATILAAQRQYIVDRMPVLYDDVCRDHCRAVGLCWGLCSAMEEGYPAPDDGNRRRPSLACDRAAKEQVVPLVAAQGLTPLATLSALKRLSLPMADRLPLQELIS